jgi:hypothetical protein
MYFLDVNPSHGMALESMPFHHRDPFDRLLIAQGLVEQIPIVSVDRAFDPYGVTHAYVWGVDLVVPSGELLALGKRSIKGVAGYSLTPFVVGSEGTLGFITGAIVHLVRPYP